MSQLLRSLPRNLSLQEQAYQTLRSAILSGELTAKDRLVETKLAKRLQVSRTPIREALRQLQQDGLVTSENGANLRVVSFSKGDAEHLYDCRLALEKLAVQRACSFATDETLQALDQLIVQMEAVQTTPENPNLEQVWNLDYEFHRSIVQCSGNAWLMGFLEQMFDKMKLLRVQTRQLPLNRATILAEHRSVYAALVERNFDAAVAAIVFHLNSSRNRVLERLEAQAEPEGESAI